MGVSTNQYVVLGLKVPYQTSEAFQDAADEFYDNGYKAEIKHKNGLAVISDGMNGKFCFIGEILHKSSVNGYLDGPILFREPGYMKCEAMTELIRENFPMVEFEGPQSIETWFFTHYH